MYSANLCHHFGTDGMQIYAADRSAAASKKYWLIINQIPLQGVKSLRNLRQSSFRYIVLKSQERLYFGSVEWHLHQENAEKAEGACAQETFLG